MNAFIAALSLFLAISGLAGGLVLVRDPSGRGVGMPVTWLKDVPLIHNFFWPGIFLLSAFAVGGTLAAVAIMGGFDWSRAYASFLGVLLMGWLVVELIFIKSRSFMQLVYFLIGFALFTLPLL